MINKHCQKIKKNKIKDDKIEGFGNLFQDQIDQYTYDVNGNLITNTIVNNENLTSDFIDINGNDFIEIIDANGNIIVNQTYFFNCNELPDQYLSNLCAERSANDYVYAEWINLGLAWWFTCYPSNDYMITNIGWEQQPENYPLPMWWWFYPEIPAPSEQWLSENFFLDGVWVPRRDYYLPPPGEIIPERIDLRNYNPDCYNYQQDIVYNYDNYDIIGVPDTPTYTREGFGNSTDDQSYLILFIIVIIIVFIVFFAFYRHK